MTRPRYEYLQHDTHWPRLAGQIADMPAEWHTLEFGRNGWELVTVVRTPTGTLTAFFKRLVLDDTQPAASGEVIDRITAMTKLDRRTAVSASPSAKKGKP